MRLLLDTHTLLWTLHDSARIPPNTLDVLRDRQSEVAVSAVSAWEIAIKQSLDKIELPAPAETWLEKAVERSGFDWIPITAGDALRVRSLPWHHRDPFDRLLIAQAMSGYTLVTHDAVIRRYGVPVFWES
jgi:PIN domain nuclease of toxin-antitoxin system